MEKTVTIRDMNDEDYDAAVEVWRRAGLKFNARGRDSREAIKMQLHDPTSIFLLAELEGRVVATALCTQDGRKGWINRLAVIPELQREGIGRQMVAEAERLFVDMGLEVFSCLIMADNPISQEMFTKLGYHRQDDVIYYTKRIREDA